MDLRTREHLARAARNRDVARALFHAQLPVAVGSPPYEWVAVIAFYAAVHLVNAHYWERRKQDPGGHGARARWVAGDPELCSAHPSYARLSDLAWYARYAPTFHLSRADAADVLNTDLAAVEVAVRGALASLP